MLIFTDKLWNFCFALLILNYGYISGSKNPTGNNCGSLFAEPNFKGDSIVLADGVTIRDLKSHNSSLVSAWNSTLSFNLRRGCTLGICEHSNFTGQCKNFTDDTPQLQESYQNISSASCRCSENDPKTITRPGSVQNDMNTKIVFDLMMKLERRNVKRFQEMKLLLSSMKKEIIEGTEKPAEPCLPCPASVCPSVPECPSTSSPELPDYADYPRRPLFPHCECSIDCEERKLRD